MRLEDIGQFNEGCGTFFVVFKKMATLHDGSRYIGQAYSKHSHEMVSIREKEKEASISRNGSTDISIQIPAGSPESNLFYISCIYTKIDDFRKFYEFMRNETDKEKKKFRFAL